MAPQGPPAGFVPPAGMTGPPPGVSVPASILSLISQQQQQQHTTTTASSTSATATTSPSPTSAFKGPPAGFSPSVGLIGPPPGFTPPAGLSGPPSGVGGPGGPHRLPFSAHDGPVVIGVTTMLLVLVLAAVGGRLIARRMVKMRLGADDYTALVAFALFIALAINQYLFAHYGARAGSVTSLADILELAHTFGKVEIASQISYDLLTGTVKASLLLVYRRIFSLRTFWFRYAFWADLVLVVTYTIALFIIALTQCSPRPLSTAWTHPGTCIPNQTSAATMGAINALIDLTILLLPIRMVCTLQMSRKQKYLICSVFALGLIAVAVSIARAVYIATQGFKSGAFAFVIWSTTEPAVGLICACLPVMRPLYTTGLRKFSSSWAFSWTRSWTRSRKSSLFPSSGYSKDLSNATTAVDKSIDKTQVGEPETSWYSHHPAKSSRGSSKHDTSNLSLSISKPLPPIYPERRSSRSLPHYASSPRSEQEEWTSMPPSYPNSPDSVGRQHHIGNYSHAMASQGMRMEELRPAVQKEGGGWGLRSPPLDREQSWEGTKKGGRKRSASKGGRRPSLGTSLSSARNPSVGGHGHSAGGLCTRCKGDMGEDLW